MTGTDTPAPTPDPAPATGPGLPRFTRVERIVHRLIAVLMTTCLVTALVLYYGPLSLWIGHRQLVELVHVVSGAALPVPVLVAAGSAAFRADLGRLDRFTRADRRWLFSRSRRDGAIRVGKFNAGQKLNTWLSAGAVLVLLGTGVVMYFPDLTRLTWRSGATFVHDWAALGVGLLVLGHVYFALADPVARHGMRTGRVPLSWARREHADWADELAPEPPDPVDRTP